MLIPFINLLNSINYSRMIMISTVKFFVLHVRRSSDVTMIKSYVVKYLIILLDIDAKINVYSNSPPLLVKLILIEVIIKSIFNSEKNMCNFTSFRYQNVTFDIRVFQAWIPHILCNMIFSVPKLSTTFCENSVPKAFRTILSHTFR